MKWLKHSLVLGALVIFGACTRHATGPNTPEGVLDQYVRLAFSAKEIKDSEKLLELTTGPAREWFSSMRKEDFEAQFVKNAMTFQDLKMKDKREDASGGVSLVYELTFRDGKGPKPLEPGMTPSAASYTMKKIAYLSKNEKGEWKIRETKNVKTFVERKEALELLTPETTDKNPAPDTK